MGRKLEPILQETADMLGRLTHQAQAQYGVDHDVTFRLAKAWAAVLTPKKHRSRGVKARLANGERVTLPASVVEGGEPIDD